MMQKIRRQLQNEKGFTLMELMVVIAVIGILAAMVLPKFATATASSQEAKAKADVRTVIGALEIYYADNGRYPATTAAAAKTALVSGAKQYLKKWPKSWNGDDAVYTYTAADGYEVKITPYDGATTISSNTL